MTLEGYLSDQYNRDLQDITAVEQALKGVARTFGETYDPEAQCWPYEVRAGQSKADGNPSQGTSAMILAAIGKMCGCCTLRDDFSTEKLSGLPEKLLHKLLQAFESGISRLAAQVKEKGKIDSRTFGSYDPLTISHLTELARGLSTIALGATIESALRQTNAVNRIDRLIKANPANGKDFAAKIGPNWCTRSAFVALRIVRAHADLNGSKAAMADPFKDFFESRLHEQLSFSSIPDSRFDPADLAFCLEGLLICAREAVDPVLFERVVTVLTTQQETSAYWRPNRPFMAKPTGEVVLPLSVEGANSLLRCVEIVDGTKLHGTFDTTAVPMFRRFWQWLRARKVEIAFAGKPCIGWHSEHVNETGVIHLWDTSQVVEFLIAFRRLLQRHIARETLVLSRVKTTEPQESGNWAEITDIYEPLADSTFADRIFDEVKVDFIDPWRNGTLPKNHSMLLYGPPGTGKTNFASSLADALSFRLITITVSDFLGAGGALVEARAKAIFQMLEAQSGCVILFDEINAFLLDRDSEHYREQDTLFQFLTPGMLTKINDLRSAARSIFIIATNYANRIDPAIKRAGRIDAQYLLLPPDLKKRKAIIQKELKKVMSMQENLDEGDLDEMAKASLYLGYKEILGAMPGNSPSASRVIDALKKAPRSNSHKHYLARLTSETTFPCDEFCKMVGLSLQAGRVSEVNEDIKSLDAEAKIAWEELFRKSIDLEKALSALEVQT